MLYAFDKFVDFCDADFYRRFAHKKPLQVAGCSVNDLMESLFKAVGQVVAELLFRVPGVLITKWFHLESDSNPDGCFVILIG